MFLMKLLTKSYPNRALLSSTLSINQKPEFWEKKKTHTACLIGDKSLEWNTITIQSVSTEFRLFTLIKNKTKHNKKPGPGAFVCRVCMFSYDPGSAWVPTRYSSFLPQCKNRQARWIGNSKLCVGVNASKNCLFLSMWPREVLAICPGWNLAFAR